MTELEANIVLKGDLTFLRDLVRALDIVEKERRLKELDNQIRDREEYLEKTDKRKKTNKLVG